MTTIENRPFKIPISMNPKVTDAGEMYLAVGTPGSPIHGIYFDGDTHSWYVETSELNALSMGLLNRTETPD